jgi:hypothetical protein
MDPTREADPTRDRPASATLAPAGPTLARPVLSWGPPDTETW